MNPNEIDTMMTQARRQYDEKYAIVCGYETTAIDLLKFLYEGAEALFQPSLVADNLSINSAAHILRTLDEHGEPDMTYWMVPSIVFQWAMGNGDNEWFAYNGGKGYPRQQIVPFNQPGSTTNDLTIPT